MDVGRAQLHNKLRQDERVTNLEKTNARHLKAGDLPQDYPLIVMDLSFSLTKVLPAVWQFMAADGHLIALVKLQFEADKHEVDAGKGIIRDPEIHQRVLQSVCRYAYRNYLLATCWARWNRQSKYRWEPGILDWFTTGTLRTHCAFNKRHSSYRSMHAINTITFAVNTTKPGASDAARYLAGIAECEGAQTRILEDYPLPIDALEGQDLCVAVGGDGTLLGVLDASLAANTAVLGVNLGKLGFLATFSQQEAGDDFARLIQGQYNIAERSVLRCINAQGNSVLAQ